MSPSTVARSLLVFAFVLFCFKTACADNLTEILQGYPDFSKMTDILKQPAINKQIKIQPAVTILGLDNDVMDKIAAVKRPEEVTDIVKSHVVLDYYDDVKLKNQPLNKAQEVVNLFQSSGSSQYGQGLTKFKRTSQGIFFWSTSKNSSANDAKFMEKIYSRQFNVSIIRIDHQLYVSGLNDDMAPALPPTPPPTAKAPAPAEAPEVLVADAPSDELTAPAPTPAPASADAPDADKQKGADDVDDTANADQAASSARKQVVGLAVVFASAFVAAAF